MKTKATTSAKRVYLWPFLLLYRPHNTLRRVNDLTLSKIPWYRRWNQDKLSTTIHRLTLLTFLTTVIAITYTFFAFTPAQPVKAETLSFGTQSFSEAAKTNVTLGDDGKVRLKSSFAWGSGGTEDGQFNYPIDIATDQNGNVYVADQNHRIQKFTSDGAFITKWGSFGTEDGQFNYPIDIATDQNGNVYVADLDNNRIQKFTSDGTFLAKWGESGTDIGQFNDPYGITFDGDGNLYVVDRNNHRIQKFIFGGTLESQPINLGQSARVTKLAWQREDPEASNTTLNFQLALSQSPDGPWEFKGPDGSTSTYFTTSAGQTITYDAGFNQFIKYKAHFSSTEVAHTPELSNLTVSYIGKPQLTADINAANYHKINLTTADLSQEGAIGYRWFRSTETGPTQPADETFQAIAETTGITYTDNVPTGNHEGVTYWYKVVAKTNGGDSQGSDPVSATTSSDAGVYKNGQPVGDVGVNVLNVGADKTLLDGANDIEVRGIDLILNGEHSFKNVSITKGSNITHDQGYIIDQATQRGGLEITATENVTVDSESKIDITGKGYSGGPGAGSGDSDWYHAYYSGAAYATRADYACGYGDCLQLSKPPYGNEIDNAYLGSSGDGLGGGRIKILTNHLEVIGSIQANGKAGRGSGGSIDLWANTFTISGIISASGGGNITDGKDGIGGSSDSCRYPSYHQLVGGSGPGIGGLGYSKGANESSDPCPYYPYHHRGGGSAGRIKITYNTSYNEGQITPGFGKDADSFLQLESPQPGEEGYFDPASTPENEIIGPWAWARKNPPQAPTNLTLNSIGLNGANLSWTASQTSGVTYEIERSTEQFRNYTKIGETSNVNFTDNFSGYTGDLKFWYRVSAAKNATHSDYSDIYGEVTPSSISGNTVSSNTIRWNWDPMEGATGYRLYNASDNALIVDLPIESLQQEEGKYFYDESGLTPNTFYSRYLKVYVVTEAGERVTKASNTTSAYTLAAVPLAPQIQSSWSADRGYYSTVTIDANDLNPDYTEYSIAVETASQISKSESLISKQNPISNDQNPKNANIFDRLKQAFVHTSNVILAKAGIQKNLDSWLGPGMTDGGIIGVANAQEETTRYLQPDGTLGDNPVWKARNQLNPWYYNNIKPNTNYYYKVKALSGFSEKEYQGHFYISTFLDNWEPAQRYCQIKSANLVTINNAEENEFIRANFASLLPEQVVWIGYNDKAEEGNWKWASGENVNYNNWDGGFPQNSAGTEDYGYLHSNSYWYNTINENNIHGVCEKTISFGSQASDFGSATQSRAGTIIKGDPTSNASIRWSWDPVENATGYNIYDTGNNQIASLTLDQLTQGQDGRYSWEETPSNGAANEGYGRYVKPVIVGSTGSPPSEGPQSNNAISYTLANTPGKPTVSGSWSQPPSGSADSGYEAVINIDTAGNSGCTEYAVSPDGLVYIQADGKAKIERGDLDPYWNTQTTWTHKDLDPNASYQYQVQARSCQTNVFSDSGRPQIFTNSGANVQRGVLGKFGKALKGYTRADTTPWPSKNITLEAWVNLDSYSVSNAKIINSGCCWPGYQSIFLEIGSDGKVKFQKRNPDGSNSNVISSNSIPLNQWVYIVGSYDYNPNTLKVYVGDTKTEAAGKVSKGLSFPWARFEVGAWYRDWWGIIEGQMDGSIDEVRVWNKALTDNEISANQALNSELADPMDQEGLITYYKFNEIADYETGLGAQSDPIVTGTVIQGEATSKTSINWSWEAIPNAVSYNIYDSGNNLLHNTADTSWEETGLTPNTQYQRLVKGVFDDQTESSQSNIAALYTYAASPIVATNLPSRRSDPAIAFDSARNKTVLFGGYQGYQEGNGALGDTWEFSNSIWTQTTPENSPSPRYGHRMVYDSYRHKVVLFGGQASNNSGYLNDTWEYDGTNWTQVNTQDAPSPRSYFSLAFDSKRNKVVFFGGQDSDLDCLGGYCYGGYTGVGNNLNDTWEYDGANWTQIIPDGEDTIPKLSGAGMVYVPEIEGVENSDKFILFGGITSDGGTQSETWRYDPEDKNWTQLSPENSFGASLYQHSMAYDPMRQKVVSFGGLVSLGWWYDYYGGPTWEYDVASNNWQAIETVQRPSARGYAGSVFDSNANKMLLFGGYSAYHGYSSYRNCGIANLGVCYNDMWEYDGTNWNSIQYNSPIIESSPNAEIKFQNFSTFGPGGVQYYRYAWTDSPDYTFTGSEPQWKSGELTQVLQGFGTDPRPANYLHVKAYNGDNISDTIENSELTVGPFYTLIAGFPQVNITQPSGTQPIKVSGLTFIQWNSSHTQPAPYALKANSASVSYQRDSSPPSQNDWVLIAQNQSDTGSFKWDTTKLDNGFYKLKVSVAGIFGEVGEKIIDIELANTAQMSITTTADKTSFSVNDPITYFINYANTGTLNLNDVSLKANTPTGTAYQAGSSKNKGKAIADHSNPLETGINIGTLLSRGWTETLFDIFAREANLNKTQVTKEASFDRGEITLLGGKDLRVLKPDFVVGHDYAHYPDLLNYVDSANIAPVRSNGDYIVTWYERFNENPGDNIYVQKFDKNGNAKTSAILVANSNPWPDYRSIGWIGRVAATDNGQFAVLYNESFYDPAQGWLNNNKIQRFNADGAKKGDPISLPADCCNNWASSIALSNNQIIYTYGDENRDLMLRRVDWDSGSVIGSSLKINDSDDLRSDNVFVAVNEIGQGVVTWRTNDRNYYFQRFDSNDKQGINTKVNQETLNGYQYPFVAVNSQGEFSIAWANQTWTGSENKVYLQRYDANGVTQGDNILIWQGNDNERIYRGDFYQDAYVGLDDKGNSYVSWSAETYYSYPDPRYWEFQDFTKVYLQKVDKNNQKLTNPINVSQSVIGGENSWCQDSYCGILDPVIAVSKDGYLAFAYNEYWLDIKSLTATLGYETAGNYTSKVFDSGSVTDWQKASFVAEVPTGTTLTWDYRTSNDSNSLLTKSWTRIMPTSRSLTTDEKALYSDSAKLYSATIPDTVAARYIQYQFNLTTTDISESPKIFEVTFGQKSQGQAQYSVQVTDPFALLISQLAQATAKVLGTEGQIKETKTFSGNRLNIAASYIPPSVTDTTPPTTTNSAFSSDWTKDNVSITLSASDSSSGVKQTFYSTDSSTPSLLYTGPITLSSSGIYTLKYYSLDNANNTEAVKDGGQVRIDKDPPSVPTIISSPQSQTQIALSWDASSDSLSGFKDYQLYKSQDNVSFALLSTQTGTDYSDTGLTPNTTYYYKVLARDNLDNASGFSNVASSTTADYPIPNSPLISGSNIVLSPDQTILTISGVTIPDADVTLEISSDPYLFTFSSDSKGYFTFALNLNDYPLSPGLHHLRSKVKNKVTLKESAFSTSIEFDIPSPPTSIPTPAPTPAVTNIVDTVKKATQTVTNAFNTFSKTLKSIIPEAITSITTSAPVQATITASTIAVAAIPSIVAPALSGAASASPSIIAHIFFPLIDGINHLFAYLYYAFTSLMYFLGIWKKPKKWGTVYDSITKKPIALSFVKLFGRHLETRVTDKDGRFGFFAPKGTYNIIVAKPGFNFPSSRVTLEDYPYSDIYYGKVFVLEKEQKIHYDIPVDPMTEEKRIFSLNRSLSSVRVNLTQPALIFSALGLVYSLIVFVLELKLLNFAILLVITTIFTLNIRNFVKSKGIKLKIR